MVPTYRSRKSRRLFLLRLLARPLYARSASEGSGARYISGKEVWLMQNSIYQHTNGSIENILRLTIHSRQSHTRAVMMAVIEDFITRRICLDMNVYTRSRLVSTSFATNQAVLPNFAAVTICYDTTRYDMRFRIRILQTIVCLAILGMLHFRSTYQRTASLAILGIRRLRLMHQWTALTYSHHPCPPLRPKV